MLPRENKVQGKGCLVHRMKMPLLTNEAREVRLQTGRGALQLLFYVLLLPLHKWDKKGGHVCKPFARSAGEICPWLSNTSQGSLRW